MIDYSPVCGYGPNLGYPSIEELRRSYEICDCDCCGCEFGYYDNVNTMTGGF